MSDATDKIIADLPAIQQIALRTAARNPLLGIVLEQATALQEIATWAAVAKKLAADEQGPELSLDDLATALGADSVEAVEAPAKNGMARPSRQGGLVDAAC